MSNKNHLFVCCDCGLLLITDNFDKYHFEVNICPICGGDMCGCKDCVHDVIIKKTPLSYIDINNELHECISPNNGAFDCMKIEKLKTLLCDKGCIYYD